MAGFLDAWLRSIAPHRALKRELARAQLDLLQDRRAERSASTYAPVGGGRRSREFRRNSRDAVGTMDGARAPLSFIARDMLRNNPRVVRANNLFAAYTVGGAGIRPVVKMRDQEDSKGKSKIEGLIADHLMTTAIDADGNSTLTGIQALIMKTIPTSGEVLLRRRMRRASDGLPLPFQVQVLEPDFIADKSTFGSNVARSIENGIEYGPTGRAEFYHLYSSHPGSTFGGGEVRRVAAEHIAHPFMIDRPGQRRGVSWYAPVMPELHDLHKFMQGTLKRQEVAAMFAGILKRSGDDDPNDELSAAIQDLQAGAILELDAGDELDFTNPPQAQTAEPIVQLIDRVIATGLMLTYEGFSGDYSRVNYTSGRMGRMDQDPVVQFWQNELMIARALHPLTRWFKEAVALRADIDPSAYRLEWTPPRRPVVDPTKDYPALIKKVRAGFDSRQGVIRELGADPARIEREIFEDAKKADDDKLIYDTDPRHVSASGVGQGDKAGQSATDQNKDGGDNDET